MDGCQPGLAPLVTLVSLAAATVTVTMDPPDSQTCACEPCLQKRGEVTAAERLCKPGDAKSLLIGVSLVASPLVLVLARLF